MKQGTVLGPTLCCVEETDQINNIGKDQTRPLENDVVGILMFVDDVMSAGTAEVARKCIRNLREIEKLKKFTFGLKKTNYMVKDLLKANLMHKKSKKKTNDGKYENFSDKQTDCRTEQVL